MRGYSCARSNIVFFLNWRGLPSIGYGLRPRVDMVVFADVSCSHAKPVVGFGARMLAQTKANGLLLRNRSVRRTRCMT